VVKTTAITSKSMEVELVYD